MLIQAILLGLVAMLGNAEYLFGTCLLSRPLIMGTLTGIVLGDIEAGVRIGATMELAFMGAFSIGASIPPEMISGTVLGTAFAITTGSGPETALAIGLPVASLVLLAKNFGMVFILPPFVHKADECAKNDNMQGIAVVHYLAGFFGVNLIIFMSRPKPIAGSRPMVISRPLEIHSGMMDRKASTAGDPT